ncbi:MAG: hypothetical protein ACOCM4_08575 [Acetivibrio ethanolgignens]
MNRAIESQALFNHDTIAVRAGRIEMITGVNAVARLFFNCAVWLLR